jgi:Arc/MetJ-type ribon-helix-helix transcriptional regulator
MNGRKLVDLKIPVEEVKNIDALVTAGYYGCRSDAIRDILRRGAAHLRSRYQFVEAGGGNRK